MASIKVYNYKEWDTQKGVFSFSERPATRAFIEARTPPLEIIVASEKEVSINEIDDEGRVKLKNTSSSA